MKKTTVLLLATFVFAFILFSCKKGNSDTTYRVTYSVTGTNVNQFKITQTATTDILVQTPFSGTKDTTVYLSAGTDVKLDAKATNVTGSIYVNDVLKATGSDPAEVKLDYVLPTKL